MSRKEFCGLAIVAIASLLIGLIGFLLSPKIPVNSDAISYFTVARNLITGKGLLTSLSDPTSAYIMGVLHPDLHMPGWTILLAGFLWLTRTGALAPLILGILLAIGSSILAYFTAMEWFGGQKALSGALAFAFYPGILIYQFTGLAELAIVFWFSLALFFASLTKMKAWLALCAAGISLFVSYLTRETSLLLIPLILVMLNRKGIGWRSLLIMAGVLTVVCLTSSYLYQKWWPGFAKAQVIFTKYSLLFKTGVITPDQNPMDQVVRPEDFPTLSPAKTFLLLLKKPFRLLFALPRSKSWEIIASDIWTVGVLVLAPLLAKGWRMKLGLACLALIIPLIFILYYPKSDYLTRICLPFGAIGALFVGTRIKSKFLLSAMLICELGIGALCSWSYIKAGRACSERMERLYPAIREALPPDVRVLGVRGYGLEQIPVYSPGITAVLYPEKREHAALLNERLGTEALIFISSGSTGIQPYHGMAEGGWREKVLVSGSDSVFIYTRRRE